MRFFISHLGVPIGEVDLTTTETAIGELVAAPGYDAIRPTIRAASEALWAVGFLGNSTGNDFDPAAFSRAQALSLELRDDRGAFVPSDFINIVERPAAGDPPVVFVRFRLAGAHVASVRKPTSKEDGGSELRR